MTTSDASPTDQVADEQTAETEVAVAPIRNSPERDVRLLSDQPIGDRERDILNLMAYAAALESLLVGGLAEPPFTIAVSGPWGSGKSSLARLMQQRLRDNSRPGAKLVVASFNAWDHSTVESPEAAIAANVARTAHRSRPLWVRLWRPLSANLLAPQQAARRRFLFVAVLTLLGVAIALLLGQWFSDKPKVDGAPAIVAGVASGLVFMKIVYDGFAGFGKALTSYVQKPQDVAQVGALSQVKEQLGKVVKKAIRSNGRIVVIIDDIDRCPAAIQLDLCTTSAQLLSLPGVVVVLLGDLRTVADEASKRLTSEDSADRNGRDFIEKIVQFELVLPLPTQEMLKKLANPFGLTIGNPSAQPPTPAPAKAKKRWRPRSSKIIRELIETPEGKRLLKRRIWVVAGAVVGSLLGGVVLYVLARISQNSESAAAYPGGFVVGGGVGVGGAFIFQIVRLSQLSAAVPGSQGSTAIRDYMISIMRSAVDAAFDLKANEAVDPAVEAVEIYGGLPEGVRAMVPAFEVRAYVDRVSAEQFVSRIFDQGQATQAEHLSQVVNSLMRSLPRNPRLHKRMMNQIFVQYLVAARRGFLSEGTTVTDSQLAKWAILMARWPEEMARLLANFERGVEDEDVLSEDQEFTRFLGADPVLGDALGQLAEMTPTQ